MKSIIPLILFLFCNSLQAAPEPGKKVIEDLSLNDAIQLAYNRNLDLKSQVLSLEQSKLSYDDAWDRMFMPNINLSVSSSSAYTLGTVAGTPARRPTPSDYNTQQARNFGYPTSSAAIGLGSYTLFNFWKDRIAFDISKMAYESAQKSYQEYRRSLKNQVTNAYFQSRIDQEKIDAAKRSADMAQTVFSLIKSRKALGKATDDQVTSASIDIINAKIQYDSTVKTAYDNLANLNQYLNASTDQKYNFTTNLIFKPLNISSEEAFRLFKEYSPTMRMANVSLRTAEGTLELAHKARLPLPTISFSGLTMTYSTGYGTGSTSYSNSNSTYPAGQMNIEASVSLSLPILGPGGLLNSRVLEGSVISREMAEINAMKASIGGEVEVGKRIVAIKNIETQILDQKSAYEKNTQLLDSLLIKASKQTVNHLEMRDAIRDARTAHLAYLDATYSHVSQKNSFAEYLGLDDFPSDITPASNENKAGDKK